VSIIRITICNRFRNGSKQVGVLPPSVYAYSTHDKPAQSPGNATICIGVGLLIHLAFQGNQIELEAFLHLQMSRPTEFAIAFYEFDENNRHSMKFNC
jgi:hypothetical protein